MKKTSSLFSFYKNDGRNLLIAVEKLSLFVGGKLFVEQNE
jgi:hypothetical protein